MSTKFHYGFCLSIINLIFLYNFLIIFNKEATKNYTFTYKYMYLGLYFSFICGLVSFFLLSSTPTNTEDELEEGEIAEETTRSSLSQSQDSDEGDDTLGDLPGYNDTIYNIIDYSEN